MNTNKLSKLSLVCCALSAVFSLSAISFNADISLLAFPLAAIFTIISSFFILKKLFNIASKADENVENRQAAYIPAVRELLQYAPYVLLISFILRRAGENGTPVILDAIQIALWVAIFVFSLIVLHYLKQKKLKTINPEWHQFLVDKKYEENQRRKDKSLKSCLRTVGLELISWIDALVQAVFMVLLLNIFVVQLYEIPSESMVPEFLVKDRVAVFKIFNGPKFPLSNIGLPYIKSYNRGDIVVFRNPHYSNDRKSEIKTFVSQLVYMCSLTTKNINLDENGNPKADPLVKRVAGVSGEQLMMQDGILYSRTKDSDEFKIVDADSSYACWNLSAVKNDIKEGILEYPLCDVDPRSISKEEQSKIAQKAYDDMIECEKRRNELDYTVLKNDLETLSKKFASLYSAVSKNSSSSEEFSLSPREMSVFYADYKSMVAASSPLFMNYQQIAVKLLLSSNGEKWFSDFTTSWSVPDFKGDLYSEANFKLNLMIKQSFARLIVKVAEFNLQKVQFAQWHSDSEFAAALNDADMLVNYVSLLDRRNMPIFPANDEIGNPQYIPENSYFMMGDNRFNSLDMRHSYDLRTIPLSNFDKYSVTYSSNMAPQYVDRSRMLGTTAYRFWPFSRKGVPGHTGM